MCNIKTNCRRNKGQRSEGIVIYTCRDEYDDIIHPIHNHITYTS